MARILSLLDGLELAAGDLARYRHFDSERYTRIPMQGGKFYELLLLCWLPGQASRFHNHSGSNCGVRVIEGVASETKATASARGLLLPEPEAQFSRGSLLGSRDRDIHRMANRGSGPLTTLHLYSMPLRRMQEFGVEPVHDARAQPFSSS